MNTIQQAHILLVDDNTDLLRLLEEQLRGAGYQNIRTVQNCAAAQTAFAAEMPELMILDINLPDGDGFSLFRTLRAKADVPTLFLSARDADADRLFGLGLGADDYLTKPFDLDELLARVQVQLRHADVRRASASGAPSDERLPEPAAATAMRYKDWTLDVDARTLSVREEPVRLTRLEFNILEALVRRPRKVFTKRELFEIAWNEESAVEEKAINVHVSNIRSKLRAAHSAGEIETVWGIGFKLAE